MTRNVAQISLFAVGLLVGLLLIGQLRSQARPTEVSSLSAQELSQLIETLSSRNAELRTALSDQRDTLREYEAAGPVGQSALQVSREDLARITAFGGLAPVTGEGITLQVEGDLDSIALNDLLNELRNAGAEALAVDQIRITHRSVADPGPDLPARSTACRSAGSSRCGPSARRTACSPRSSAQAASSRSWSSSSTLRSWPPSPTTWSCLPPRST